MATVWILLAQAVCQQLISATITNIAHNKTASMSSPDGGFHARTAVDGNTNAVYPKGIIQTTGGRTTAWWKVDLMTNVHDAAVKIYFRTDYKYRRNGSQLYTSTTLFSSYPSGHLCHTVTGRADGTDIPDVVSVNCTGTWRYLMVYTEANNDGQGVILDFGEVEVLACTTGTYGPKCTKPCSSRQCAVTPTSCHRYTAACPEGRCKTGWTGSDCAEVCSTGKYGQKCMKSCASRQCAVRPSSCDSATGACPSGGCLAGYKGADCMHECTKGRYGLNCEMLCSNRHCEFFSETCGHVAGNCSGGCEAGWMGNDCLQVCPNGTYGPNCLKSCADRHCRKISSSCDRATGQCSPDGCEDAWTGTDCSNNCPDGTFGINCSNCSMRHCEGESGCPPNGTCTNGCQDGWTLPTCTQVCSDGRYGRGCNHACGHCADDASCDHRTGNCPRGCEAGWQQDRCQLVCEGRKYGVDCAEDCGQCVGTCNATTGHCQGGCQTGYNGTLCKEKLEMPEDSGKTGYVIPAVAGAAAGLLVIIIIIVAFIVYRRRRNLSSREPMLGGKRPHNAANVGVYENVAVEPIETMSNEMPTLHAKPISTKTGLKPKLIVQEDEEEILEESDPVPNKDYYNDIEEVIREIPVEELEDTVQKIKHRKGGFEAEYGRLPTGFTASYDDSQKPENAGKNKFIGYYPYDHNRVRLSLLPDLPGSDYINASVMHSYDRRKMYIAAQAPNKKTLGDFWRMIWEHQCGLVIMLTGLVEDMKVKCYQYWPVDGVLETDHYKVKVDVTDTRANYTVRGIEMSSKETGQVRTTVQYHYTSWPDHGVPDTLSLVNFIWMIRRTYVETDGPLLVHCSAGIGRTGTYIAVDTLLDQVRGEGMVDVLGYVSTMRGQRKNMIQTKEQYECVFQCLVEMTKFGDTSMDVHDFADSYTDKGMENIVGRKSLRELTQLMLTEDRQSTLSPPRMWVDGNQDFIVRVGPTLRLLRGYLLTETPPKGLEKLLWKLVEENNVDIVVAVTPLKVNLGDKGTTNKYGGMYLTTTDQTSLTSDLTLVTLSLKRGENSHNVKLFKVNGSLTLKSMSSLLLDHGHLHHLSTEMSPVVLIHGEADRKATVLFSIMGNILSGIEEDRRVDVIGHVRAFLKCCPDVVISQQDITKLLEFAQKRVQLMETGNAYANM